MKVYPVIHFESPEQSVRQADIAFSAGSDGVFLINHGKFSAEEGLIDAYNSVRAKFPDEYIGLNFLSRDALGAFEATSNYLNRGEIFTPPNGIWADDAFGSYRDPKKIKRYLSAVERTRSLDPALSNIQYLGGVAFKYTTNYTDDPKRSAKLAEQYRQTIDVVTTSGPGTGFPPSQDKIIAMKKALGDKQLAVASGIDITNVRNYQDNIDMVLIATGIETSPYSGIFVPRKVRQFIEKAKGI